MIWRQSPPLALNGTPEIASSSAHKPSQGRALRIVLLAFIVLISSSYSFAAPQPSACKGPAGLEQTIAAHPSPGAYDALGSWFARQQRLSCALSAFESAIRLDPKSWEGHYNLGITLLTNGNAQRAVSELKKASDLNPGSGQILLPLGAALSDSDRKDEAIGVFREILKEDPKSVKALDGLTKALIAQKRYTAAIAELKNAPADEVLQLNLAVAYSKNDNPEQALETLKEIVAKHPDYGQGHFNMGAVYIQENRYGEAAEEFHKAVQLDPSDDVSALSYIKALVVLAQFDKAKPLIDAYRQRHPHDFDSLYFSGVVEKGLGNNAEAEKFLRQAVAIDPNFYDARYNLGFVLARLNRPAEAKPELEAALKLSPDSSKARFQLANVLRALGLKDEASQQLTVFEQQKKESIKQDVAGVKANQANVDLLSGDPQKAVDLYRESIAQDPANARTYYDLALALDRMANYTGEREALEKALSLDAQLAPPHNQLGILHLKANQTAEAEKEFQTAISLDAQYAEAQNNLGVIYGQQGKAHEAEQLFRYATENNPQYGQAFANFGLILASEGKFPEAFQALSSAIKLEPKNTGALSAYGMVLVRLNRGDEALSAFKKVTELDPRSAGAHLNLGIALADQFDLNGALAEFTQAVNLDGNSAVAHYNKGRVLLDLQRNAEARPELETATRIDPNAADSWYLLGLISRQAGETDASINYFEKALAVKPDNAEGHFMLGQELVRKGDNTAAIEQWRKAIEIRPQYNEAIYSLSRLLAKSDPQESARLQNRFKDLQEQQHIMDRSQTLGNFALASAEAHDWPKAIAQLKEGIQTCGSCSALPQLHKDLGLIYCHSGDFRNGKAELLEAQKLSPEDEDVRKALQLLETDKKAETNKP